MKTLMQIQDRTTWRARRSWKQIQPEVLRNICPNQGGEEDAASTGVESPSNSFLAYPGLSGSASAGAVASPCLRRMAINTPQSMLEPWGGAMLGRIEDQREAAFNRRGRSRRRRRTLCTIAVITAYVAACLPCGRSFVVPSAGPSAHLSREAKAGVSGYGAGLAERGSRTAARRKWRADDAVRMVSVIP